MNERTGQAPVTPLFPLSPDIERHKYITMDQAIAYEEAREKLRKIVSDKTALKILTKGIKTASLNTAKGSSMKKSSSPKAGPSKKKSNSPKAPSIKTTSSSKKSSSPKSPKKNSSPKSPKKNSSPKKGDVLRTFIQGGCKKGYIKSPKTHFCIKVGDKEHFSLIKEGWNKDLTVMTKK